MNVVIRPAIPGDAPTLLEIERMSFSDDRWQEKDFLENDCLVADVDGCVKGFLVSRQTFPGDATHLPEREILNLAVSKDIQRKGIATHLLRSELARKATFFLEVRESNLSAQSLYRKFGFVEIARRKDYYNCPNETAIVMQMK